MLVVKKSINYLKLVFSSRVNLCHFHSSLMKVRKLLTTWEEADKKEKKKIQFFLQGKICMMWTSTMDEQIKACSGG